MSLQDCKPSPKESPPSIADLEDRIRSTCEASIRFCTQKTDITFYQAEQSLLTVRPNLTLNRRLR